MNREIAFFLLDQYIKNDIDKLQKELEIFSKHQDSYYDLIKRNEILVLNELRQYLKENLK